jgi:hypothetical protein
LGTASTPYSSKLHYVIVRATPLAPRAHHQVQTCPKGRQQYRDRTVAARAQHDRMEIIQQVAAVFGAECRGQRCA